MQKRDGGWFLSVAIWTAVLIALPGPVAAQADDGPQETDEQRDGRMAWWREARFGLFIHWGLYAVPAGEWKGATRHAEWIMHTAQIPVEQYEEFVEQFNPVKFDADEWVRLARDAGMNYIVITSKHHDGFSLFDSAHTDYDVMATPFRRDIMKELADACGRAGLKIGWYHSIMDWHHPDYLPRRPWEKRSAEGADLARYIEHLKNQVRELLSNYGPIGVMWFDGEWEGTWKHEHGRDLYAFVRGLQPDIIVNNRVDKGRAGMQGMTRAKKYAGDFGTPEQEIPPTGLPGIDWETCMTMNRHWGYNKSDQDWKSTEDLLRKLADIASKGGNFLLNVGPTAEGEFPAPSVERLRAIGQWMRVNGESIHGTRASPFKSLPWGRCTQKTLNGGDTRLYLHVFDWPANGELVVGGLFNEPKRAHLLANSAGPPLAVERRGDALVVKLPSVAPDPINSVVVLDVVGRPDVADPPVLLPQVDIFVDILAVTAKTERENVEIRYTTDGTEPTAASALVAGPIRISKSSTVSARVFRGERPVSPTARATYTKVTPRPATNPGPAVAGLHYEYYEGEWDRLPDFDRLPAVKSGTIGDFDLAPRRRPEAFGFRYTGFVTVPRSGLYTFSTESDDGSRLYIGDRLVVDNDGLHGVQEARGAIALAAGSHPITVTFFEKSGGDALHVFYQGPGVPYRQIPPQALSRTARPEVGWEVQRSGVSASLRGLCAVSRNVAWASGSGGTFVRTDDGGRTWKSGIVPGAETLDFRDVQAFDQDTAILLSAGEPARVYKTSDGGASWRVTYENKSAGAFFDALAFWDPERGIAFSDPVDDGAFLIITTNDGGETWTRIPPAELPEPLPGEAGFAAGGTCLTVQGSHNVWIGTGGAAAARVLRSADRGRTWTVAPTPVQSGNASSGIFSLVFHDSQNGVIVGGDYQQPERTERVAARTDDGGATWSLVEHAPPAGYRSCVAFVPNTPTPTLVAVGPNGSDLSVDGGRAWQRIGSEGYHSVSFAADGAGWAVGAEGRVARFVRAGDKRQSH